MTLQKNETSPTLAKILLGFWQGCVQTISISPPQKKSLAQHIPAESNSHFPKMLWYEWTLFLSFGESSNSGASTSKKTKKKYKLELEKKLQAEKMQLLKVRNECKGPGLEREPPGRTRAKVSAIIITVCCSGSHAGCVFLSVCVYVCWVPQHFAILWGSSEGRGRGVLATLPPQTGQDKYTIATFLARLLGFSLERRDGRAAVVRLEHWSVISDCWTPLGC